MRRLLLLLAMIGAIVGGQVRTLSADADRPKLVILISIDQFRADYLSRFHDLFLPAAGDLNGEHILGGFRYLEENGASYADAQHTHYPLFTGPGTPSC